MKSNILKHTSSEIKIRPPRVIERYLPDPKSITTTGEKIKFVAWNMNSIRSVHSKNSLADFLLTCKADIIGVTELRGSVHDTFSINHLRRLLKQAGYRYNYFNAATPVPGLYGTAIFSKIQPTRILKNAGSLPKEGRNITAIFQDFITIVTYTPTLQQDEKTGEITRIEKRVDYDNSMSVYMQELKQNFNKPIIYCGDLNTIVYDHHIYDKRLIGPRNSPGFSVIPGTTTEEQIFIQQMMKEKDLIDSYEIFHPHGSTDNLPYTFFWPKTEKRIPEATSDIRGIKVDHFLCPKQWAQHCDKSRPRLMSSDVMRGQTGSDHLPIEMTVQFPPSFTFKRPKSKSQFDNSPCVQAFESTPINTKRKSTHPLLFRGIHLRSPFASHIAEYLNSSEVSQLLNIVVETEKQIKTEMHEKRIKDTEILMNKLNISQEEKEDHNEFRESTLTATTKPRTDKAPTPWIPHILSNIEHSCDSTQIMLDSELIIILFHTTSYTNGHIPEYR